MTSISGTTFGSWTLVYDDQHRLTSVTYPGGVDTLTYNALGQRMRANLDGAVFRYVYAGDRVLERTNDAGAVLTRYTLSGADYFSSLLHFKQSDGTHRYPLADIIGTARRLVSETATVTDTYSLDAFGRKLNSTGTTPNPYRFGAAWGYMTDTPGSGLLQLGARFYWPELGRFITQDPSGEGMNWYAYVDNDPVLWVDPEGLRKGDWFDQLTDFSAGFGDLITLGLTARARKWMDTDEFVNQCSGMYRGGQWAGVGWSVAMGAALGARAAGAKGAGSEFSHFIPRRFGGPRSIWNGNYVGREVHALSDPLRYRLMPRAWKEANPIWSPLRRAWVRLPNVWEGLAGGAGYGAVGTGANDY